MQNGLYAFKKRTSLLLASVMVVGGSLSGLGLPQTASAMPDNSQVVISQVYGGGGNSGAPYKSDFIELYNPTDHSITLDGMKLVYGSAAGAWPTSGDNIMTLQGTIGAGQYYLTKQADGTNAAPDLPTPDATGKLALSGTSGKVKLMDSGNATLDLVGYGSPSEHEGASAVSQLSNTTAAIRLELNGGGRGLDTDVNGADFRVAAPDPRNSAYGNTLSRARAKWPQERPLRWEPLRTGQPFIIGSTRLAKPIRI
jgi:2',3'-cyclic-nucleotide 2'-phosphodiesterase/3'-nucleotidase/5'-nucleotidase